MHHDESTQATLVLPRLTLWAADRRSRTARRALAMVMSALAAVGTGASLVGSPLLDMAWAAVIGALSAHAASSSKRMPLLVVAVVATATAGSLSAAAVGVLAVILVAASTLHVRREALFTRGVAGGAIAASLLASARHQPGWQTLVVAAGAAALVGGSYLRRASRAHRRTVTRYATAGIALVVLATASAGLTGLVSRNQLHEGTVQVRLGLVAARAGDVNAAQAYLEQAASNMRAVKLRMDRWGLAARAVPGVAQQVSALVAVLADAEVAAGQAGRTARAVDMGALTVQAGWLDLGVVEDLRNPLGRLAQALVDLRSEIDHRLATPLAGPIRDRLAQLRVEVARSEREALLGADAATVMPRALGAERPQRYLVLFTSPAEARGRFGFPGAFAEVTVDHGQMQLGEHGNTSEAFAGSLGFGASLDLSDPLLLPYLPFGVARQMRSVTIPPDFGAVAKVVASLWAASGREPLDGVLRFDPRSLAALMRFTGPVAIPGLDAPLTPTNLEQFLIRDQYLFFQSSATPRRDLLDTVSEVTFERLMVADLPSPRALVDLFGPLASTNNLEVAAVDPGVDAFLERIGVGGTLAPPVSDSLLVTNVNSTGNKIDTFLDRSIRYDAVVRGRHLSGRVAVELHNRAPSTGLPFYVIGSSTSPPLPLGTNRTTLFVYTTVPASRVAVDGRSITGRPIRSGGRWLYQALIELPPGGRSTVTLDLDGDLPAGAYSLVLEPGGGVTPDHYSVVVDVDGRRITSGGSVAEAITLG